MTPAQVYAQIGHDRSHIFKRMLYLDSAGRITRLGFGLYQRNYIPDARDEGENKTAPHDSSARVYGNRDRG